MKIAILSRKQNDYFNQKFLKLACDYAPSSLSADIIDPFSCRLFIENSNYKIFSNNKELQDFDVIFPTVSLYTLDYGIEIVKHFEKTGAKIINSSSTLLKCRNKFDMLQNLSAIEDVRIPKSLLIKSPNELKSGIKQIGGLPVVLKMYSDGNKSLGAILAESLSYTETFLEANFLFGEFAQTGQNIIIQEFIQNSVGKAVSYIILGEIVLAGYISRKSLANPKLLLSEPSEEQVKISDKKRTTLLKIAKEFGLDFGTISVIEGETPIYFEINLFPDTEEIEKIYKIDVISELFRFMSDF